ncbi:MAG TPA: hypothetical protein VGS03_02435 [Candidatus Polarisedimenticolia bacterium]|jgi:hypothetical protein|nr:hypothetical protein [Candidatus Polarisedimenticolia bacterium]
MASRAHEKDARDGKDQESVLPPGQRDRTGFWYPAGYADPQTLVRRRPRRSHGTGTPPDTPEDLTDPS